MFNAPLVETRALGWQGFGGGTILVACKTTGAARGPIVRLVCARAAGGGLYAQAQASARRDTECLGRGPAQVGGLESGRDRGRRGSHQPPRPRLGDALADARKNFANEIRSEGVLLLPRAALPRPAPTPGSYN